MRSIIFRWVMRFAAAAVNSCSKNAIDPNTVVFYEISIK